MCREHTYIHTYMYVYMYVCTYIYVCIYVCMCVCSYNLLIRGARAYADAKEPRRASSAAPQPLLSARPRT